MNYLGLPLGASYKDNFIWNGIVEKWNVVWMVGRGFICLKGGGLNMIKNTLSNFLLIICLSSLFL
jgi:hypothetical protein